MKIDKATIKYHRAGKLGEGRSSYTSEYLIFTLLHLFLGKNLPILPLYCSIEIPIVLIRVVDLDIQAVLLLVLQLLLQLVLLPLLLPQDLLLLSGHLRSFRRSF